MLRDDSDIKDGGYLSSFTGREEKPGEGRDYAYRSGGDTKCSSTGWGLASGRMVILREDKCFLRRQREVAY